MPLKTHAAYQSFGAVGASRSDGSTDDVEATEVFGTDFAFPIGVNKSTKTMSVTIGYMLWDVPTTL